MFDSMCGCMLNKQYTCYINIYVLLCSRF